MSDFSSLTKKIQNFLKNRSKTDFVVLLFLGILIMIIAIPTGNGKKEEEKPVNVSLPEKEKPMDEKNYREELEQQLKELLTKMEGVGKCEVMITLADGGRVYVDKNVTSEEGKSNSETVVYKKEEGELPYVIRKDSPRIEGVVVVAPGGENPRIVSQISAAVMSLFHLEAHKITVVKMSVQEE